MKHEPTVINEAVINGIISNLDSFKAINPFSQKWELRVHKKEELLEAFDMNTEQTKAVGVGALYGVPIVESPIVPEWKAILVDMTPMQPCDDFRKKVFIFDLKPQKNKDETEKCWLEYNEEGLLTCTYNHTLGALCLGNKCQYCHELECKCYEEEDHDHLGGILDKLK